MNSKQRLSKVTKGNIADRIPFMPTILERSAKIIHKAPSEVAKDRELMAKSHIEAFKEYHHDIITVGIDVYNIEAEAMGCKVKYFEDNSIPGIDNHPYNETNFEDIEFSMNNGRIADILYAAKKVKDEIGEEVNVSIGISGPFSIAVELVGYTDIIMACYMQDKYLDKLFTKVLNHQIAYCDEILALGIGITIFESWATPPLTSPDIYAKYVAPYEKKLISHIKAKGSLAAPLIIGGNTQEILDDILNTGTTLVVADFEVDIDLYLKKAREKDILLRINIDPKLIEKGTPTDIIERLKQIIDNTSEYAKTVIGTGVVAYDTPSENIHCVRKYLEQL